MDTPSIRAASSQTNKHLAEDDDEDERSDSDDGGDDQDDDEDQEDQPNHGGDDDNDDFDEDSYHRQVKELQKKAISHFTELKQQSPISD